MRVAGWALGAAAVAVALFVGWTVATDWREMKRLDGSIAIERGIVDSLKVVRKAVDSRMREVAEEVKTLPQEARLGRATRAAREFAKQQELVEGRITRSQTRIRNFEAAKDRGARQMRIRAAAGGGGWVLILLAFGIARRRRAMGPGKVAR
jgi:hypothetical protein